MGSGTGGRPTAKDVAKLSGVSRATVSYVLNNTPSQTIPDSTRDKVLDAAHRLGYVPSAAARALARGTADVVIIDVSDVPGGDLLARTTKDLAEAFAARNYHPVINQYTPHVDGRAALLSLARTIVPAAVVTLYELPETVQAELRRFGVERVHSLLPADDGPYGSGTVHTTAQVEYLVRAGHRKLLYVGTADPNLRTLNDGRRRAAREHGTSLGATVESWSRDASPQLSAELRKRVRAGFTAVVAYNDEVAIAVLGAAARAGIDVPDQLAVIGIDDIPLASEVHPRLTTVTLEAADPPGPPVVVERVLSGELIEPFDTLPRVIRRESA